MQPLVSIIIPVYNLEEYVGACLQSVQAQTYPNWEAVCIDDGSTDGSLSVLRAAQEKDSRIRALHYENGGLSAARNRGMKEADGDFIFFLDGDDLLHPQAIDLLVRAMQDDEYDIVVSRFERITKTDYVFPPIENANAACRAVDYATFFMLEPMVVRTVWANLYRRETALRERFDENCYGCEDVNYMFRLLSTKVRLAYIDQPLYGYMVREGSITMRNDNKNKKRLLVSLNCTHESCEMLRNGSDSLLFGMAMQALFKNAFSLRIFLSADKEAVRCCNRHCKAFMKSWLRCRAMPLRIRLSFYALYRSPLLYKTWRVRTDPTLRDYFKRQKKGEQHD